MILFVIHRFEDNKTAKIMLKKIAKVHSLKLKPVFLACYKYENWKDKANELIESSEAIIIFNKKKCLESENTKWEMDQASNAKKELIELSYDNNEESITKLRSLYNMITDFENCFSENTDSKMDLYNLMIQSSEQLVQRRQSTNAFFITALGSLFTVATLIINVVTITMETVVLLYVFAIVGLLLCNSWRNLIDNYGKLNKAKFDVILRLEKDLYAQVYSAEWIALGKGKRKDKYRSFTSTEKNVPLYFGILILILLVALTIWIIFICNK